MNFSSTNKKNSSNLLERREFVSTALKTAGVSMLLSMPGISKAMSLCANNKDYTVQDVIDIILKEIPGAPFKQTVDTIKSGSADQKVTGIVTTMFATVDVINQAAQLNANFIIAHEPTFYNHTDDVNWVPNNGVVKQKQDLLLKNNIAVWRFHDYWHAHRPDGIGYGVLKKTGWLQYYKPGEMILTIPGTSLKEITQHVKSSLGIDHVRVIGDLTQSCERIALIPGAAGGQMQISLVEKQKPDILIVGEVHEWETAEYIRDARLMGSKTSLVILGHSVSEEPGMEYLAEWLQPKVPELKITHVASNSPFTWV
jgi:putative NIF3 family GTP cyclohydrolase 1 type 2